ncbi:7-deoxyloganetin glucosyltransferase-like [Spinacia oleracea]|uniref:7-deoxyloganetin glucosyltransferase-like n=1 Tax=Spinacia oleracea TaxID=3562 RepID=A0A9R0I996_SPIOL|nr:7-deoxyloganetin glucosyltransferase-like [Spinacia oleracea]
MGSLAEVRDRVKLHAVCVPFPTQGHISPMLNLAKLLHSKGFHITFVNTESNHRRFLRSRGPNSFHGLPSSFRLETIPDGIPPCDLNNCIEPFKKLLKRLNDPLLSSPPITFILSDCMMPFTFDTAREVGDLPVVLLWTASACGFLGYAQYRPLLDKVIVPFKEFLSDESEIN